MKGTPYPSLRIRHAACTLIAGTLLAITSLPAAAQHWETIVDLPPQSAGRSVLIDPFSADPSLPDLFIGGSSPFGSVLHVEQSTSAMSTSDPDAAATVNCLGRDALGNLYSAGEGWQVRTSTDGGVTWTVIDDAGTWWGSTSTMTRSASARGIATDPTGRVFITGITRETSQGKGRTTGGTYWVIRRGTPSPQGWTWNNSFFSGSLGLPTVTGAGIVFVPSISGGQFGGLFAAGTFPTRKGLQWAVLRSRDAGSTWQQVDAFGPYRDNIGAYARAITADSVGNLYVAGYDATPGWYVRRSMNGGNSWETILTNYAGGNSYNRADAIAADVVGNVYVAGMTQVSGSGARWTIRRWDAATQAWDQWPETLRHPLSAWASVSAARSIVADNQGRVYVAGDADGHWLVQRLVTP